MDFQHNLEDFIENKRSSTDLKKILVSAKQNIWNSGLNEEELHLCVQIFLENEELSSDVRNLLLLCLVPRVKIPIETIKALLAWFFTSYSKHIDVAQTFLKWLSAMLASNLVDSKPVESLRNEFLLCFYYSELVAPICNVLKHVVKPGSVTPRTVFIAKSFYDIPVKYPAKSKIACLLRLLHANAPSLLPNPPKGKTSLQESPDDFQKSVSNIAFENGFINTIPLENKSANSEASTLGTSSNDLSSYTDSDVVACLADIKEMKHLGWMIKKNKIPPLQSISQLLGCKAGEIYLCWMHMIGRKLPSEDKRTIIPYLGKFLKISRRIRDGLPVVPKILSQYLVSWDGEENKDIIYNNLMWIHFDSFEELYTNVLCHVINLFFTGTIQDKVNILDCLTNLTVNKVTKVSRQTSIKLIALVTRLIKVALAEDGFHSTALLLSCLRFYQYISILEERYMLGTWTVPPPFLVFGAFFSRNYVVISEICDLVVRHNTVMSPFFHSMGISQDFQDEEEIVKTYLRDLYFLLWKGQATKTELFLDREDELPWLSNKEMDSLFTVRSHCGILPLLNFIGSQWAPDDQKRFNEKSLLKLFDKYASGYSAVKTSYENMVRTS